MTFRKALLISHLICLILVIIDAVMSIKSHMTFRGLFFDRAISTGLIVSGGILFFLFFRKVRIELVTYFGIYFFYPIIVCITFFFDRLAFVIIGIPLLLIVMLPETYYSDDKIELRSSGGLLGP